jgi:hypothetical protein
MMPRAHRAYLIATCAIIGGAFAYAACEWGRWPRLIYAPLAGGVTLDTATSPTAMAYLGIVAWGIGGAGCGALVGAAIAAAVRRPLSDRWIQLFGAWAITALLLAGLYFTWGLWPWG